MRAPGLKLLVLVTVVVVIVFTTGNYPNLNLAKMQIKPDVQSQETVADTSSKDMASPQVISVHVGPTKMADSVAASSKSTKIQKIYDQEMAGKENPYPVTVTGGDSVSSQARSDEEMMAGRVLPEEPKMAGTGSVDKQNWHRPESVRHVADQVESNSTDLIAPAAKSIVERYHFPGKPMPKTLSQELISGIKKFVYFAGYHRSGHSIVGSLLDAHPHVVIAHEYFISSHFRDLDRASNQTWRDNLFNLLYKGSIQSVAARQQHHTKGYSLGVEGLWQGRFQNHIEVIGDKSGGRATKDYLANREAFISNHLKLKKMVGVPMRIIHVLRNPFDMISTDAIIKASSNEELGRLKKKVPLDSTQRLNVSNELLTKCIEAMFTKFDAVADIIARVYGRENVLEVHNCDLVADPRGTLVKIFRFLEVGVTEHYLDVCEKKVFKTVSRSRDLMVWSSEHRDVVENGMKNYEMLKRYNFTSD